jgi:type IV pilus assembly protein PilV
MTGRRLGAPRRVALAARERGVSLVEGLIALAIFGIGVLALVSLQGTLVGTSSNAQYRAEAAYYAEQIIGFATADPANVGCYAFLTGCSSTLANAQAQAWLNEVQDRLPAADTLAPAITWTAGTRQFQVVLRWKAPADDTVRNLTVTTSIR